MSEYAIQAQGLSKCYRISASQQNYTTLRESLVNTLPRLSRRRPVHHGNSARLESVWALQDVSLKVAQGEVLGLVGRNGAGKSTLLKILSRITRPTSGEVRLRGRVGSLLEVGTGFHPELSGRENIYLNGAILGMHGKEIAAKFQQIVEFSEIDQYLDTPVKRYSSGMYMRLAFSVAAHLEPEILLVDEVLAVGDAAFQKKCLGKMGEVAGEGRTVLFVSHNMGAIQALCPRTIFLADGRIVEDGPSAQVVESYLSESYGDVEKTGEVSWEGGDKAPGCDEVRLLSIRLLSKTGQVQDHFNVSDPILVEFTYQIYSMVRGMRAILVITTREGVTVFATTDHDQRPAVTTPGVYRCQVSIPGGVLNSIQYAVQIHLDIPGYRTLVPGRDFIYFTAVGNTPHGSHYPENWPGVTTPRCTWQEEKLD